jgi:hypothetical protein
MDRKEIQQGIRVDIPTSRAGNEAPVYFMQGALEQHHYPHPFLVIGEPYAGDDNVRLYMVRPFPQFCVESFNGSDLSIYNPI